VIEAVDLKTSKKYLFLKRLFDICFSLAIGIICMPVMLVIALMVRLSSPGTVLYKQERLGINGKKFNILKFRTMREDAEKNGPQWAEKEDDRCTKLGVVLRKCRLDELPQLWNICNLLIHIYNIIL
jgi:lipopolysaccharide/colanic/teichoic acid biosynthesis glycosyltransferase